MASHITSDVYLGDSIDYFKLAFINSLKFESKTLLKIANIENDEDLRREYKNKLSEFFSSSECFFSFQNTAEFIDIEGHLNQDFEATIKKSEYIFLDPPNGLSNLETLNINRKKFKWGKVDSTSRTSPNHLDVNHLTEMIMANDNLKAFSFYQHIPRADLSGLEDSICLLLEKLNLKSFDHACLLKFNSFFTLTVSKYEITDSEVISCQKLLSHQALRARYSSFAIKGSKWKKV